MKVTFVSNYINHHQLPFCREMYGCLGEDYRFIQTQPMEAERVSMGWGEKLSEIPYLRLFYEAEEECRRLIDESDVVLFGGVEDESYISGRLQAGKPVVRLSERLYKDGQWKAVSPRGLRKKYLDHTRYRRDRVYLLCCGGYVASDFHIVRAYPGKMFRWGYFPETEEYNIDELLAKKREARTRSGVCRLLWAGRFIDWKHPEYAILAAERLKAEGYAFSLDMVGGGEMEQVLQEMVRKRGLQEQVIFRGFQKPGTVRGFMKEADVFLFTSDYREGWGAVLNEAMNSGCAVVADCGIGAVPFLAKPGENALIYRNRNFKEFYGYVTELIHDPEKIERLGRRAYQTITREWNAHIAAERLIPFLEGAAKGAPPAQQQGILSPAPVIAPGRMYGKMMRKA